MMQKHNRKQRCFWQTFKPVQYPLCGHVEKTMKIGTVALDNPFILAPLAGYTDIAFRLLCREMGAGLTVTEMISCHGLVHGQEKTLTMIRTVPAEFPLALQLFGSEPEIMGRAAAIVSDHPVQIIDINMGCPVRKVVRKGAGSALMKEENVQRAAEVIQAVVGNTDLPVTVKFRSGWTEDSINAPEFAAMAEAAGAAAVTIHARTWKQQFGGLADRRVIGAVKQAVAIPVIGNGDISSHADGLAMMAETGCDGVMAGRGALGNPWLFLPGRIPDSLAGRLPVILRYLELVEQYLDVERLLFRIKNHVCRYLTGLRDSAKIRKQVVDSSDLTGIRELLQTTLVGSDS
jgi:nifR3 family TIM-barrel protein